MHSIDIAIIVGYLVLIVLAGYYFSQRAKSGMKDYFLGGNQIPWYILGVSNASGMFDITGTMWMVSLAFVYGVKSAWIPWMWPVWNQIFLMIFLAVWLRRSNVMTGAEWLQTRFGDGRGYRLSHIVVVVFALIAVIGFIAYGFEGIGKFTDTFLPWDLTMQIGEWTIASPKVYATIVMLLTSIYVVKGGMYSVVFTELLQFIMMTVACLAVGAIAIYTVSPEMIQQAVPEGWSDLSFGWTLDIDWSEKMAGLNDKIKNDGYYLFGPLFMMMLFKGFLVSVAGPVPSYDMQRILAAKKPTEAAKMSGIVSLVLFIPRYLMIFGLTVLALVYLGPELNADGGSVDFEKILPLALDRFIPIGLKGLLLAGLLSAFMSTFAANVNAGPAYLVNDIYKKFINPDAPSSKYLKLSYLASFLMVIIGIAFGFMVESIDGAVQWITAALFGGYTAPNLLKWVWWRLNGEGYFWGMCAGIATALLTPVLLPEVQPIYAFPFIFGASLLASVLVSLYTKPEDDTILMTFYTKVRPWGFWKPIADKCAALNPEFEPNKDFGRDMRNSAVGVIWQLMLHIIPMYIILRDIRPLLLSVAVLILTTFLLKKYWYDRLEEYPADTDATLKAIAASREESKIVNDIKK